MSNYESSGKGGPHEEISSPILKYAHPIWVCLQGQIILRITLENKLRAILSWIIIYENFINEFMREYWLFGGAYEYWR